MAKSKPFVKDGDLCFQWDSIQDFDHTRRHLNNYEVVYAQFCHENLRYGTRGISVLKLAFLPLLGLSTYIPSGHHRYVRFHVNAIYEEKHDNPLNGIWGVIERIEQGPTVWLHTKGEAASKRSGGKLARSGFFGGPIEMKVSPPVLLGDLFIEIGRYNGDYNLAVNNCINYGLEVWRRLGGNISWSDVCGGHVIDKPELTSPDPDQD